MFVFYDTFSGNRPQTELERINAYLLTIKQIGG